MHQKIMVNLNSRNFPFFKVNIALSIAIYLFLISDFSLKHFGSTENLNAYTNLLNTLIIWFLISYLLLSNFILLYFNLKRENTLQNSLKRVFKSAGVILLIGLTIAFIKENKEKKHLERVGVVEYGVCIKKTKRIGSYIIHYRFGSDDLKYSVKQVDMSDFRKYNIGDTVFVVLLDPDNHNIFRTIDFWD